MKILPKISFAVIRRVFRVSYSYERLSSAINNEHTVFKADKVLSEGWTRRNYEVLDISKPMPWAQKSEAQRSHNFYIQSLDMIDPLLAAYSDTGDVKYLTPPVSIVLDWIDVHQKSAPNLSPLAWYDMAVGLRAYRMAYLYEAAKEQRLLTKDQDDLIWQALEDHINYLADDKNIAFHNNHGYYQIAGQVATGRRFYKQSNKMAQAFKQGQERLIHMLHQQFAADGVHREHSPDYHRMVYDTLKSLISSDLINDEAALNFSEIIEEALSWFVFPDQKIVNFGDSDARLVAMKANHAKNKWNTDAMRFMVTNGGVGKLGSETMRAFTEGGYWIVRKPHAEIEELKEYSYLAFNAAFHSRTHKHADDLSFVWYDHGMNILVDAGRYGYIGKTAQGSEAWLNGHWYADPMRMYCESTRAHNALEFDGKDYPRKGAKPYGSALQRYGQLDSGIYYAEAESKYFKSIRHARTLIYQPRKWLIILDWFHDNLKENHDVKQWFHFDHRLQLQFDEVNQQFIADIPSADTPLRVASLLSEGKPSEIFIAEEDPLLQGWWSPKEREAIPNYACSFNQQSTQNGNFATIFSFTNELETDAAWSKINVSGRKGQVRWTDAEGKHELKFERPESGCLVVNYDRQ